VKPAFLSVEKGNASGTGESEVYMQTSIHDWCGGSCQQTGKRGAEGIRALMDGWRLSLEAM